MGAWARGCALLLTSLTLLEGGCADSQNRTLSEAESAYEAGQYDRARALVEAAAQTSFERAVPLRRLRILSEIATGRIETGLALLAEVTPAAQAKPLWKEAMLALLRGAMRHENFFVRSAAIKAIGETQDRNLVHLLLPALKDSESFVRFFAVEALGQMKGDMAVPLLMAAGVDPETMVRVAAVKALDAREEGARLLVPFTKDAETAVRAFAWAGLAKRGDAKALSNLMEMARMRPDDPAMPAALGMSQHSAVFPLLEKMLTHTEAAMRMYAAEALGHFAIPEIYPLLAARKQEREASARAAVIAAVGRLKDAKATSHLLEAALDSDLSVRIAAAEGLARRGQWREEIYQEALRHEDYGVRHFAVGSLRKVAQQAKRDIRQSAIAMLLQTMAMDTAQRVRIAAVRAIGALSETGAIPALKERLRDEDLSVRAYAAGSLYHLLDIPSTGASTGASPSDRSS